MVPGLMPALPPQAWDLVAARASASTRVQTEQEQRPTITLQGEVEVKLQADFIEFLPDTLVTKLSGNVTATYPPTLVTCDEAELDRAKKTAIFRKGVKLTDPVGTLTAEELRINFERPGAGYARGIVIEAHEAHFEGSELVVKSGVWRLKNAWVTVCDRKNPDFRVLLPDVVFKPGRYIAARKATVVIGRGFKVPVPLFRVGLAKHETGFQFPAVSLTEDFELGYRWRNMLALGNSASFLYEQTGRVKRRPSMNAQLAYSLVRRSEDEQAEPLAIRNEDRERFQDGFLDNVIVPTMQDEEKNVGRKRAILFAGRTTNIATVARVGERPRLDRDWYAGVEAGGAIGGVLANAQLRYGSVEPRGLGESFERTEAYGTVLAPHIKLGNNFAFRLRADAAAFLHRSSDYGWVRPQAGLVLTQEWGGTQLQVTGSYIPGADWGTPLLDAERLYSMRAAHVRVDLRGSKNRRLPTEVSFLAKYDFDRNSWYDFEFGVVQVMHCVRANLTYRKFPGSLSLGFQLRADKLFEALSRRKVRRETSPN